MLVDFSSIQWQPLLNKYCGRKLAKLKENAKLFFLIFLKHLHLHLKDICNMHVPANY